MSESVADSNMDLWCHVSFMGSKGMGSGAITRMSIGALLMEKRGEREERVEGGSFETMKIDVEGGYVSDSVLRVRARCGVRRAE